MVEIFYSELFCNYSNCDLLKTDWYLKPWFWTIFSSTDCSHVIGSCHVSALMRSYDRGSFYDVLFPMVFRRTYFLGMRKTCKCKLQCIRHLKKSFWTSPWNRISETFSRFLPLMKRFIVTNEMAGSKLIVYMYVEILSKRIQIGQHNFKWCHSIWVDIRNYVLWK